MLVASVVGMIFVPWQQTAPGYGEVVALDPQQRAQPVLSQIKGIISYVKPGLREGIEVEQGELLLKLEPLASEAVSQIDTQIAVIEAKRVASETSMKVAEQAAALQASSGLSLIESLNQELKASNQKWLQAKNEIAVNQAEFEDKKNQLRIAEEVATQGLVSKEELFSKRQAVEAQFNKLLKAENSAEEYYASLMSKEDEIEAKKQEIDIKNRSANQKVLDEIQKLKSIEKDLIDLQTKRGEFDRLEVRAPRSGVIHQWYGLEGSDTVKEGDRLFVIVPHATDLAVELKISGNDMPLVKEGDHVRLQFEGWPAIQFVGWPSVAVGTFGGKVNRIFPTDDGKGSFSLVVTPEVSFDGETEWPDNRYLRQGVRANGWVLLRQVTLGYEIWRQLNGFPPVISTEEPKEKKDSKIKLPKA
ncbi:MAG: HlyD family efflux transporter periplasmic adaptor subunit [Pirellulales bacterium]